MSATERAMLTEEDRTEQEITLRSFGERLRATRQALEISQETLERRACLAHGMVSKFELARQAPPGLFMVLRLADGLRVDPGILLDALPVPRRETTTLKTLAIIQANPGVKLEGVAEKLKVRTSYARRQIMRLANSGSVVSHRGGWATADHLKADTTKSRRKARG